MAVHHALPDTRDLVTFKEAVELFAETGYPVSETTLKRWAREAKLAKYREGTTGLVSFSDLLMVHRDRMFKD